MFSRRDLGTEWQKYLTDTSFYIVYKAARFYPSNILMGFSRETFTKYKNVK